jgi:predicted AlkP superfamily pyrophosphatase or phosphodiesterase
VTRDRPVLAGVMLVVLAAVAARATTGVTTATTRHVILISIDALRPEFYLDPRWSAATLRALAAEGSHALAAESVFPTVTYPSHASIVTGVRPIRHGVGLNTVPRADGAYRWYEREADLRAPPLWAWARAAGLTSAGVAWPSIIGGALEWIVAERDYWARKDPLADLIAASTPGLFERLGVTPDAAMFKDVARWDEFNTAIATALVQRERPNLLLVHFAQADLVQHQSGRDAPGLPNAIARIDGHVAALRRAVDAAGIAAQTTIVVTGDHGFQDVKDYVYPNHALVKAGLRGCPRPDAWRATFEASGGGGAVYVYARDDRETIARVEDILRREAGGRYVVLTRAELDALGALPGAALGLEAAPGWALGASCDKFTEPAHPRALGTHGFLPTRPSMAPGFIAAGAGIRRGVVLDRIRLIDIAPTLARVLGVPAPPVEGRVLEEILAPERAGALAPGSPRVQ